MNYPKFKAMCRLHLPILAGFIAIVAIVNYPLLLNINSHVIGRPFDDVFEVLWQLSWMETAVFDAHVFPFYSPHVFYPEGWFTASGAQPGWYFLLLAPLTHFVGATTTFNLAQLGTYVIGAFGVYALTYHLTKQRWASFIAGCIYISAPVFTVRQGGHLHTMLSMQALPYAVLFIYRQLETPEKLKWKSIILASFFMALTILGIWYFLFIATLPLLGLFFLPHIRANWKARLTSILLIGAFTLIFIAPFAYLTWQAREAMFTQNADFSLANADAGGLSLDRLFVPNPMQFLWGEASMSRFPIRGEQDAISIGLAALFLAALGVVVTPWKRTRPFVAVGIIALILAMGMTFYWNGQRVLLSGIPYADQIAAFLYADLNLPPGHLAIPLPGLLFYKFVPFYASMRIWARFSIQLILAVSVLAGFGAKTLWLRGQLAKTFMILIGLLILFEGMTAPYRNFTEVSVNAREADAWLASLPPGTSLIEYPRRTVDKIAMYSQAHHGQSVVNGYMSIEPAFLQEAFDQLGTYPQAETVPLLREWQVDLVLVNARSDDTTFHEVQLPMLKTIAGLCYDRVFMDGFWQYDETHVFVVTSPERDCPSDPE